MEAVRAISKEVKRLGFRKSLKRFLIILGLTWTIALVIVGLASRPAQGSSGTFLPNVEAVGVVDSAKTVDADEEAPCFVSHKYPDTIMKWCEIITAVAHQNDMPPNLLAAVILQESGGDAEAYSSSGAVGLMQVMPRDGIAATFECTYGPCFAGRPTIQELEDPEFNINYGAAMLAGLINRLGSTREALKAYGPMDIGYSYADKVLSILDNNK